MTVGLHRMRLERGVRVERRSCAWRDGNPCDLFSGHNASIRKTSLFLVGGHGLFPRFATDIVSTALRDTPVVMVTGPRQCGKTTLVRDLLASEREFVTMDDDTVLAAAPQRSNWAGARS